MMTTTITDKQIKLLKNEAIAAGDYAMADICAMALTPARDARARAQADEARAECARAIASARDAE